MDLRRAYPFIGKARIHAMLVRKGFALSVSTVGRILSRALARGAIRPASFCEGRVKPKRRRDFAALKIGSKEARSVDKLFEVCSNGVKTQRDAVMDLRRAYPFIGKARIHAMLVRKGFALSVSTVGRILSRALARGAIRPASFCEGRVKPKRRRDFAALKIGSKEARSVDKLFEVCSNGVKTQRDAWVINPSLSILSSSVKSMISFYNSEVARWIASTAHEQGAVDLNSFVNSDPTRISWSVDLKKNVRRGRTFKSDDGKYVCTMYRPFTKQWLFFSRVFNERVLQMPRIFPDGQLPNRVISVSGTGARAGFSALMIDTLPNLHTIDSGQCFPFWLYETSEEIKGDLLEERNPGFQRLNAITGYGLQRFQSAYPSEPITREDIFHYVYGLLHSEDYRNRYRANLAKELPRIPCVKPVEDYRAFRDAGKRLGELHVGYESVDPYPATIDTGGKLPLDDAEATYRVTKMRHPGSGKNKDRSTVIYNPHITIRGIPEAAWDYVINGKPALSWVMERQCVKTDKASGIVSDANRYAIETVGDPRYPLELFLRVITVSLETMKIVRTLPKLAIE